MTVVPDPQSDRELIVGANRGDRAAMETLYYRYRDWVFAVAQRACGNEQDALDVLQQTFIYFFGKFPGFELRAQLKTFLYPVVRNLATDVIRKRRDSVPIEEYAETLPSPVTRDLVQERHALAELIVRLPEEQREVVLLRFADGLTLEEIAQCLQIPIGTVKSRLHHALATLRHTMR